MTLALCAATILARRTGPVVTNLSTSRVTEDVAAHFGAPVFRTPVGEVNVARRMQREAAVVGGEGNGGVILSALHLTRDAPLGCALVLQHLLDEGITLREAAERWPVYTIVKEKLGFPREKIAEGYRRLASGLPGGGISNLEDGFRMDWASRGEWLHVRPSGTEPVVRLIAEARDGESAARLIELARELLQ